MNIEEVVKKTNTELDRSLKTAVPHTGLTPATPVSATSAVTRHGGAYDGIPAKLEHSLLDPSVSKQKIEAECALAVQYGVGTVVVSPYYVEFAAGLLCRTGVKVCSAAGFPHGALSSAAKSAELRECMRRGASEMDVTLNVLAIKSGEFEAARRELIELLQIARSDCRIKAIYEQSFYTDEEKKQVLTMIRDCGCGFVKISNAVGGKKAEEEDVRFVRALVGDKVGIKIDGGVKTLEKAVSLFNAGADRIGLTATIEIAKAALV